MKVLLSKKFKKNAEDLPPEIQSKIDKQLRLLSQDIRHPKLHTKKLKGDDNFYSVRVTRQYRILFTFYSEEAWYVLDVGHRKDIYR